MLSNKLKYDDFGELVWKEPTKIKRASKKFTYNSAFKLLGIALI
jgi:hypothetical protein